MSSHNEPTKPLRVFLVVSEEPFYHPDFIRSFLELSSDDVVGTALVVEEPKRGDANVYIQKHLYYLRPRELVILGWRRHLRMAANLMARVRSRPQPYSVASVLDGHRIPFFEVRRNINQQDHLDRIAEFRPDVVVSSSSMLFGKRLLKIPRVCCLNRHSGLLPSYGGLMPAFHTLRNGEEWTGTTFHLMTPIIDGGGIVTQNRIRIEPQDTLTTLYDRSFEAAPHLLVEALDRVRQTDFKPSGGSKPKSYFSFPTHEEWRQFRRRGGRFV